MFLQSNSGINYWEENVEDEEDDLSFREDDDFSCETDDEGMCILVRFL